MISDHKTNGEWKTQVTMDINFFLLKILTKGVLRIQRVIT